jgi:hypothetical protein
MGPVSLDLWPTIFGIVLMIGGKHWYIVRMAILYEDMIALKPELGCQPPS